MFETARARPDARQNYEKCSYERNLLLTLFVMLENCYQKDLIEAGCDEAGRGCLAGSVFAAAVILPPDFHHPLLNDSKQMSARNRDTLRAIIERESVAWAVAEIPAGRIDEINILNASFEGMNTAIRQLSVAPQFIAVDGNRFRTQLMRLHEEYPQYGWDRNKGYPTREHRLAIRRYGLTPYHRLSFNHEKDQLELF